jgi:succinyl-diaminopimelate desuccinylase
MKKTEYDKLTAKYQKDLLKSLSEFVAINSAYDESTVSEKDPFGIGVSTALAYIYDLARNDGFEVTNYDNKVVEILYGRGKKNLTIMAHADVVPAGTGWDNPPFKMIEKKGVLYGRGVADDKGPLLATYYAMKALRDHGELGGYQIRFLVGGNEESGSLCMEHYFKTLKKPQPTYGFSPDSDFPLIFAEKGIITFEVSHKVNIPHLISVKGGTASNAVIEKCEVKFDIDNDFLNFIMDNYKRNEAQIHTEDDVTTVTFLGKAAHGALPELGINAGMMAISALADYTKDPYLVQLKKLYSALDGSGFKCGATSKDMGHNSSNVGLVSLVNGELSLTCNFRYVDTCEKRSLLSTIKEVNKPFNVKIVGESPLLFFDKENKMIRTLMQAYAEETNDFESEPLAIGGGTYAKEANNVVAFGMQFPGWESNMHSPGESTKKEDLFKGMSVYARAIVYLGKLLKDED